MSGSGSSSGAMFRPPSRRSVSLLVLFGALALVLSVAPDALLVVFAGLLVGAFFGGGGEWLAARAGIGRSWGVGLFILLVLAAFAGAGVAFAPSVAEQLDRLVQEAPEALSSLKSRLTQYSWGDDLIRRLSPGAIASEGGGGMAALTGTFGAAGNFVIMLFVGLYVALDPAVYRRGLLALLAPSCRAAGDAVVREGVATLKQWLVAQLMAMAVVGVLTGLGMWLIGVPLPLLLGLIAALLAFIPTIGPVLAAIPGVLLGISEGPTVALMAVGVYVGVQTLESYFITPLIQRRKVSLPPCSSSRCRCSWAGCSACWDSRWRLRSSPSA